MPLPLDNKLFEKGYCVGEYEVTVDVGPRIRLPRIIIRVLNNHGVKELWRFADPTGLRMIICPGQNRHIYIKVAKKNLPANMNPGKAYRKFICVSTLVRISDHGKVSIPSAINKHIKIKAGEQVVIVGVGQWYELWHKDDWLGDGNNNSEI